MIIDTIENFQRYCTGENHFGKAFDFLFRKDISTLPDGWHPVAPGCMRAGISNGPGRERHGANLESHRNHIDLQFILHGVDRMGWKPRASCHLKHGDYDSENDVEFFQEDPDMWLEIQAGMFVIFFPEDAHMPQIGSGRIHKVVVKIPNLIGSCGRPEQDLIVG
jgi:biofilm protein TabA